MLRSSFVLAALAGAGFASESFFSGSHGQSYGHDRSSPSRYYSQPSKNTYYVDHHGDANHNHFDQSKDNHVHNYNGYGHHGHHGHHGHSDHHHAPVQDLRAAVMQAHDRLEKLLGARQVSAHFLTNKTKLRVNLEKAESEISRPFCVEAGKTVELDFQATIEITDDYVVGFELRRDGMAVARTRAGDDEGPSSLSLIYRATMSGASSF